MLKHPKVIYFHFLNSLKKPVIVATEKEIQRLEKEIFLKMMAIKSRKISPKDSGIGKLFNILKAIDEVSYGKNLIEYRKVLDKLKS